MEIPAHLNPTNDPKRARELLALRDRSLRNTDDLITRFEDGKRRFPDRGDWDGLLARMRNIREHILNWSFPENEPEDLLLEMQCRMGDAAAAAAASTAAIVQQIVNLPEEKLADFTEEERVRHFEMTKDWEEHKEKFLGILPIAERKRLERKPPPNDA